MVAPPPKPAALPALRSGVHASVVGEGEPLVLIHGLSGSARWWRKNVPVLARQFRVYTIDLIGFGHSRRSGRFMLEEASGRLVQWMDDVGLDRAHLVGHSMGGLISANLTLKHPERINRLVLVSATVVPFSWGFVGHGHRLARALPRVPLGFLFVLATDSLRAGPLTLIRAARQLVATDIMQHLESIRVPTLAVWGARDPLVPVELGERVAAAIPSCELVVIRDAGHVLMWEQPREFNQLITTFLSGTLPLTDAA